MNTAYLLFPFCVFMLIWMLPKIPFIEQTDLSARETRLLLCFKILSGIFFAFYFENLPFKTDYLDYNDRGKIQYEMLLQKPVLFFTEITNDIKTYGLGRLFETSHSFWAYIRFNLLFKFIGVLNLVTRGNFYFNTVLFCSIVFFAHIAFYRIYSEMYKGNKLKILFACFCLPSLLLYTSCIHKDGIIFLSLGFISYIFYRILSSPRSINLKYCLFFLIFTATIFLFRNYVIIAMVPAMFIAFLCRFFHTKKRYVFLITYSFFSLLFFLSAFSNSFLNLPAAVVHRKADFASLAKSNTDVPMNELHPTLPGFIHNLPQAINHYLFRPYLWEFPQLPVFLTAVELFFYQLVILAFIFFWKKPFNTTPFNIFGFTFLCHMMLIIGYTIPNIGAIVRYRSIFWIFLICPLLCSTDWKRLISFGKHTTHTT